jgi:hypothetical protein
MTSINQPPETVGQLSGKASGTFLGLKPEQAKRLAALALLTGNIGVLAQGGLASEPLEIAASAVLISNSIALGLWPKKPWAILYLGYTLVVGSGLMVISALEKSAPVGQIVFGAFGCLRGTILCLGKPSPQTPRPLRILKNHQQEIFGITSLPSRAFLFYGGIMNREPGIIAAAVEWAIADVMIFCSGRAEKKR